MPATLYLVGTPLGNLEDITLRAARILREADLIACEDTRRTGKLLAHLGVKKPLVSYHQHNEARRAEELVGRIAGGETVALVSDAGMPRVSDPGYRLVHEALEAGLPVVPIPGPDAVTTALVASGLPLDSYAFHGFLPSKKSQRRKALAELAAGKATLVFYEAPHRIVKTLDDALEILGDRPAVVAREMTKLHEEILRGRLSELVAELRSRDAVKGEIVLLIGWADTSASSGLGALETPLSERVEQLTTEGASRMEAIKQAARERKMSKSEAYRLLEGL